MYQQLKFVRKIVYVFAILLLQSCANNYSAKPIEAWVIDAETKQPMEGVNVVAVWMLEYGLEGGGGSAMTIMETVTDKNGRLYFPAWGPKEIPKNLPSEARLKDSDPELQFFKKGYRALELRNDRPIPSMWGHGISLRSSDWGGKKIEMTKLDGTVQDYGFAIPSFNYIESRNGCEWKYIPRMIVAISREQKRFKEQNIAFYGSDFTDIKSFSNQDICGSAESFFRANLKSHTEPVAAPVHAPVQVYQQPSTISSKDFGAPQPAVTKSE